MIAIIDYGMGNLRSVSKAVEKVGAKARIINKPDLLKKADALILPGVGAFGAGIRNLNKSGLAKTIKELASRGVPLLGICLGYQLFFDKSAEQGSHKGLGLIKGDVVAFKPGRFSLRIPHMGWNEIKTVGKSILYSGVNEGSFVYFVHSYYPTPVCKSIVSAWTDYGVRFAASVEQGNIFGTQFHPEKSGDLGLAMLTNFIAFAKNNGGNR